MSENDRRKWNKRYREGAGADGREPSAFLQECLEQIPCGRALDVACGAGRNALYLADRGFDVDAVDISAEALERARKSAQRSGLRVNWREHDLDDTLSLDGSYQLIVIIRYVNLPLMQRLTGHLAPGGYLLCEEHLVSEADVVGPTNPAYRVRSADLAAAARELQVLRLEEILVPDRDGRTAALARLLAHKA